MNRVTFFTKPECTLCRAALYVIKRVQSQEPFELDCVDISLGENKSWFAQYKHDIPVVHLNGVEIFRHRVNERQLRECLRKPPGH